MKRGKKRRVGSQKRNMAGRFCKVYGKVIRELYHDYRLATAGLLFLSLIVLSADFIELKLLEQATNGVSAYLNNERSSFASTALAVGLFLLALLAVKLLSGVYNLVSERYKSSVKFDVEKKVIKKLSAIRYEYFESNEFYEKINLARQTGDQYANAVSGVTQLVNILLMLVVYGWMLSRVSLWFVGLLFLSIAVCSVVAASVTDRQLEYWVSHVSPEERRRNYFMHVFTGRVNHQNIQTGRTFPYFSGKFQYFSGRERKNYLKLNLLSVSTDLTTSLLFLIAFFVTAMIVGGGVVSGKYEIGYFTMVMALLGNLFDAIKSFAMFIMREDWYVKVLEAYYDVLELHEEDAPDVAAQAAPPQNAPALFARGHMQTEPQAAPLHRQQADKIEIKNLRYRYMQAQDDALRGVDLTMRKGEKIALVGENGSGKTTLISVLLGLLEQYNYRMIKGLHKV